MPPSVYDTPPDGDFARYVEELGREATQRLLNRAAPGSPEAASSTPTPTRSPNRQPSPPRRGDPPRPVAVVPQQATASGAQIKARLVQLFQWGFAAFVVFLIASAAYPPLALAAVPLLLAFGALAWVRLRGLPWSDLIAQARKRAGVSSTDRGARDSARHPK